MTAPEQELMFLLTTSLYYLRPFLGPASALGDLWSGLTLQSKQDIPFLPLGKVFPWKPVYFPPWCENEESPPTPQVTIPQPERILHTILLTPSALLH